MPNLRKIKDIVESDRRLTLRKCAEAAGLTEQGLHGAINKGDIKFSYLDKIANYLKVDLSVFSDFATKNTSSTVKPYSKKGNTNRTELQKENIIIALPEKGTEKIIKADGTIISIDEKREYHKVGEDQGHYGKDLMERIDLQRQLIDLLQEQLAILKKEKK